MAVVFACALPNVTLTSVLFVVPIREAMFTVVWYQRGFSRPLLSLALVKGRRPAPNQHTLFVPLNQSGANKVVVTEVLSLKFNVIVPVWLVPLPECATTAICA